MQKKIQKFKNTFSFVSSKLFYFILGLSLALNIFIVHAAWNTNVANTTPLTPQLWNDLVAQVSALTAQVSSSSSNFGGIYNIHPYGNCLIANPYTGACSCPAGYNAYNFGSGYWELYYQCLK